MIGATSFSIAYAAARSTPLVVAVVPATTRLIVAPGATAPAPVGHVDDITAAVKAECAVCGHWMLFDSLKFRTGQERIMLFEADEEEQRHPDE